MCAVSMCLVIHSCAQAGREIALGVVGGRLHGLPFLVAGHLSFFGWPTGGFRHFPQIDAISIQAKIIEFN